MHLLPFLQDLPLHRKLNNPYYFSSGLGKVPRLSDWPFSFSLKWKTPQSPTSTDLKFSCEGMLETLKAEITSQRMRITDLEKECESIQR